jgi:hypothetical protein
MNSYKNVENVDRAAYRFTLLMTYVSKRLHVQAQ